MDKEQYNAIRISNLELIESNKKLRKELRLATQEIMTLRYEKETLMREKAVMAKKINIEEWNELLSEGEPDT